MDSIENIKEALIKACVKSNPSYFKPYLNLEKVTCDGDKKGFYNFFKYMLSISRKQSEGDLYLKIKLQNTGSETIQHYKFYDTVHLHSRLTIIVEETNDSIHLNVLPF